MLCSILVRRLSDGVSFDDFRTAWYPDQGFGIPARVLNAVRVDDGQELLSIGWLGASRSDLLGGLARVAAAEAARHDRIAPLLAGTLHRGIYEVVDDNDFGAIPRQLQPLGVGLLPQ
jgi:hypothetical protein